MIKKIYIQVPTYLVRNEGVDLNATDFTLACLLKNLVFTTRKDTLMVDHITLKHNLGLNDSRVLKTSLHTLYRCSLIKNQIVDLPRKGALMIDTNSDEFNRKPFTQLPASIFNKINEIGLVGFRLLFYYESYINRTQIQKQFCFSSYKTISEMLGISQVTLNKYNDLLVKNGLLSIHKSNLSVEHSYNDIGAISYVRYNNHYTPNLSKI